MRGSTRTACLILLLPLSAYGQKVDSEWTIRGGTYDGVTVPIDAGRATKKGTYWRLSVVDGKPRIVGWNPSRLPAPVAFRGGLEVAPADSAAFWASLRRIESDMGMSLFQPVVIERGHDPDDVIVIDIIPMTRDDGLTLVTWSSRGSVYDARVHLRSIATLRDERVVTHEMMHALGFGHTNAWHSAMNPWPRLDGGLTREDVAYAQLAIASRAASEQEDMWSGIALAASRKIHLVYGQCELFTPPVRSPAACTSVPCSAPSARCEAVRSTAPSPEH